ncbi:hypothetical protein A6769_12015 [Nostoc punctiforme NIES-2108]|uniref:Uncharacterized protein n=1 Tax=Nostoc punctiforme NIES-2108 TaxID=1356359 RepID=A0A367RPG4_NOSPU|nr:hypothetical protein A6769_12015 [Nostoc punctiforme NIES-2108]
MGKQFVLLELPWLFSSYLHPLNLFVLLHQTVGRSQTGSKIPILYLYGEIVGIGEGLFRSFSRAKTWIDIAFLHQPISNEPNVMEARWQQFELVFMGTNGS